MKNKDEILNTYWLSILNQQETENMNGSITTMKEIGTKGFPQSETQIWVASLENVFKHSKTYYLNFLNSSRK